MDRDPVLIDLALQGGGSHGAFTWGVLDRLLEEPQLRIVAISGTSAGAMNAAVLADGWTDGGAEGARAALDKYWQRVSRAAAFSPLQRSPLDRLMGQWTLDTSPAYIAMDLMSRLLSPYDLNPLGFNPLRNILVESIDFDRLGSLADQAVRHRDECANRPWTHISKPGDHGRRAARLGVSPDDVPSDRNRRRSILGWRLRRESHHHAADPRKRRPRYHPGADQSARTAGHAALGRGYPQSAQ